ncbi:MAG: 50S ribosomal protein L24 [bacterium]|nr:50S ribosomal protein L24 [bacterium]
MTEKSKQDIKIKKGDTVYVIAGNKENKGKIGKVLKVFPKTGRVLIEGINYAKKSMKPDPQKNRQGGIQQEEMPLDVSNVMIFCTKCSKPVRIKMKVSENGKQKFRVCHKCGEILDKTK